MELGPKNHNGDGLLGPNSIMVVYMDPLGSIPTTAIKSYNKKYLAPRGKGFMDSEPSLPKKQQKIGTENPKPLNH